VIIRVDPDDPTPTYEQIRAQVTMMALAGTLPAGTRLPTIRQLSFDLGLSKGTVAKAYEELERNAVIETDGRRGSFVLEPVAAEGDVSERLHGAAEAFAITAAQVGATEDAAIAAVRSALERFGVRPPQP
jgi:DNA-binding transcriptional regulator YhcF (GntR family)